MNQIFQIGDFSFQISCEKNLPVPAHFLLFEKREGTPEYTYEIHMSKELPEPEENILAKRQDLIVWETAGGEGRLMGIKGVPGFYGAYRESSKQWAEIFLAVDDRAELELDPVFTSLFALERRMMERDSLILHCAYVEDRGKAILFSAPSGTGKSTQAALWERFRGSRTINGDRALLRKIEEKWFACGWPVCGSSEICHVKDVPIYAIVMLKQGKQNKVKRLSPVQAFTKLYSEITINQWNRSFVQQAVEMIEDLIVQVPVYELTCDISENAVKCLECEIYTK